MLGVAFGHLATAVWILGLWPLTTVAHRIWRARRACGEGGGSASAEPTGLAGLLLWRWRRGTLPFDVHAAAVIAMLIFWDIPEADPLRSWLAPLFGA